MLTCMSEVIVESLKESIARSPFVGIYADESTDISVYKRLIIYIKLIQDGKTCTHFAKNIDVSDGTAATITAELKKYLEEVDVTSSKLAGFGSDGAAVMTGKRTGVGRSHVNDVIFLLK
jgi:hypothetical protein